MKLLLPFLLCVFGCSTTVYNAKTGKPEFRTYADAQNISYAHGAFHADTLTHSVPTRAAGTAISTAASGLGAAAAGLLTH